VFPRLRGLRIVIPLKKFLLSSEETSQPIPTLSDRQFVVAQTKLSQEEESLQRELFWYREELFKCLRCRWKEVNDFPDIGLISYSDAVLGRRNAIW